MTTTKEAPLAELQLLEDAVRKSDGDGVRARWASGRYLLTLKNGKKQLPKGTLNNLANALGVARSELGARMTFAAKFPTEEKLSTGVESFPTWTAIRQHALINKRRVKVAKTPYAGKGLQHAIEIIENVDPATLGETEQLLLGALDEAVRRLKESLVFLKAVA